MKRALLFGALLLLSSAPVHAQGLNLTFGDCGGATTATWTCTSNSGRAFTVVCSVVCPAGITTLVSEEGLLDIWFPTTVPEWWKIGTGYCRPASAILVGFDGRNFACLDYFGSVGPVIGSYSYQPGPDPAVGDPAGPIDANHVRIRTISAVDVLAALQTAQPTAGEEHFMFSVGFSKAASTGAGACAGCTAMAWMRLARVTLHQASGLPDLVVGSRQVFGCGAVQYAPEAECSSVPTTRSSWGQVKALYR